MSKKEKTIESDYSHISMSLKVSADKVIEFEKHFWDPSLELAL